MRDRCRRRSRQQCRTGDAAPDGGGRRGSGRGAGTRRGGRPGRAARPFPASAAAASGASARRRLASPAAGSIPSRRRFSRPRGEHGRPGPQPAQHPQVHRPAGRRRDRGAAAPRRHGGAVRRQPAAVAVHRAARPRHADADHRVAPLRQDAAVGARRRPRLRRPRRGQVGGAVDPGLLRLRREHADRGRAARPGGRVARRPPAAGARGRRCAGCSASPSTVVPFAIVPFGWPQERKEPSDRYDEARVHTSAGDGGRPAPRPAAARASAAASTVCLAPARGYSCHSTRARRAPPSGLAPARQAPPHGSPTTSCKTERRGEP